MLLVIGTVLLLPLISTSGIQKVLDERIADLQTHGLHITQEDQGSSYFTTKQHYEFSLEDPVAFSNYLQSGSAAEIPPYVQVLLDDVIMGMDLSYSNLLISDDIVIDLYPIALNTAATQRMQDEDAVLYKEMQEMLQNREFMYHMEYDIAAEKFKGKIIDIDRTLHFADGRVAKILFDSAHIKGKGSLMKPEEMELKVQKAELNFDLEGQAKMRFSLEGLKSDSHFKEKDDFEVKYAAKALYFYFENPKQMMDLHASDMKSRSQMQKREGKLHTKFDVKVKTASLKDKVNAIAIEGLEFDMDAKDLDEVAFDAFNEAQKKAGASSQYTMLAGVGLLSKGLSLDIEAFKIKKITINDSKAMDGFDHKIDVKIVADDKLVQKMQMTPLALMQNVTIDAKLRFSQEFYGYINQDDTMIMLNSFAKKSSDEVIFEIELQDNKLKVNDHQL